jgi:hypothetical protein
LDVYHHHHKHPALGHLTRSVSSVTVALSIVSSVSQLFSYLVGCSGMILKEFGFVAFFAAVKASSFRIYLSCLVCCLSVVRGEWSRLFCWMYIGILLGAHCILHISRIRGKGVELAEDGWYYFFTSRHPKFYSRNSETKSAAKAQVFDKTNFLYF